MVDQVLNAVLAGVAALDNEDPLDPGVVDELAAQDATDPVQQPDGPTSAKGREVAASESDLNTRFVKLIKDLCHRQEHYPQVEHSPLLNIS